ncbi:SDR family oxidoreductase [Streptomyces sp. SID3343]|uniref:SDR family oxidoreductase n=1 Tax=Streptomyces sp. SID3343 TaxID=2690260 RepID=UPI00137212CB|nr:SDR family oxidoreductase [Streptomyces sp. SID3343]MYW02056.1 SDR family NAD(P)-dependent oxidoreductase [Streptomyces sp. SID3343]
MTKSVVVTGATGGIGLAVALELAGSGFDVIGTARTGEKAERLREAAERAEVGVRTVLLDVADATSTVRAFTEIATMTGGGPWAVVNNAGIAQPGAIEDVEDDRVRTQLETNLIAPARIARLVLPQMRQRRDGRIVNISSISGRVSSPFVGWYCASKQALASVTDALRIETAGFGVKVVLIEPGNFGTDLWERGMALLPQRKTSAYSDSYDLADDVVRRAKALPDPTPVAHAVRTALSVPRPRARYLVGNDARAGAVLDLLAPTALSDYAKGVATGLRTPPEGITRALARLTRRHGPR